MLPPSIEKSGVAFEPDTTDDGKPAVRWGMGSIKGIGSYAAPLVRSTRGKGITKIEDIAKALAPFGNASGQARALAAQGALNPFHRNRPTAAEHLIAGPQYETGKAGRKRRC